LTQIVIIRTSVSPETIKEELAVIKTALAPSEAPLVDVRRDSPTVVQDLQWDRPGDASYHLHMDHRRLDDGTWKLYVSAAYYSRLR
jgi:hypothetical protein